MFLKIKFKKIFSLQPEKKVKFKQDISLILNSKVNISLKNIM